MERTLHVVGRAEKIAFPGLGIATVPARIDTGAKTSAIWASGIIEGNGVLQCVFFGPDSKYYTGKVYKFTDYSVKTIASSIGVAEERYVVKLVVAVGNKKIRASFTLANRSEQVYPVLVGRNVLRGKFIVDVVQGSPLKSAEKARSSVLQAKHQTPTKTSNKKVQL